MKTEVYTMLAPRGKPPKLFSDFNTLQFSVVLAMVVFVPLAIFMTVTKPCGGLSADPPKVFHPVSMPNALREDAMMVSIMRDGAVYFGSDRVYVDDSLADKIRGRLKDRGVERKVYIRADARARWCDVKEVLEGVRSAEVLRVAFLVDERRTLSAAGF